ncbi:hypothetical protein KDN24_06565 [Bacillus sp. Bva_UNVM-123]|uniref:hypothetical protein n=1 Tax=Bacillus sp. Bva_UNVM-123 TaxID=2829798 RepID=UPI00391FC2C0
MSNVKVKVKEITGYYNGRYVGIEGETNKFLMTLNDINDLIDIKYSTNSIDERTALIIYKDNGIEE